MKELELKVSGMHCEGCERRIKNVISEIKEVKNVEADHENGKVKVELKKELTEDTKNKITENIEKLDFKVVD